MLKLNVLIAVVACHALQPAIAAESASQASLDERIAQQCPAYVAWQTASQAQRGVPTEIAHPSQPKLRTELLKMAAVDQQVRDVGKDNSPLYGNDDNPATQAAWNKVRKVDTRNLARLKQMIAKHGFPTAQLIGRDGVSAAWLIVQHANDNAFQASVLKQLPPLVESGDVQRSDFALLTDRVLAHQKLPQRFGTQFTVRDGVPRLDPIEDPQNLDARRASMNLSPMSDYICTNQVMYGQKFEIEPWPDYGPE